MTDIDRLHTVAITGGTFDPIHRGHVDTVLQVCQQIQLDRVHYIPAAVPPHRAQPQASASQRLDMVTLALAEYPHLTVDDRELQREGPSYTIDTLAELDVQFPDASLILLLGIDAFLGLPDWHRWTEVLDVAHIVVMNRPGWDQPDPLPMWWSAALERQRQDETQGVNALYTKPAGHVLQIDVTPVDASSTAVRERIARGDPPTDMLSPAVIDYIAQHQLYGWHHDPDVTARHSV